MNNYIIAQHLYKSYSSFSGIESVLDNVDLNIKRGEFVTFVGPNGTGKTTLIKILSGLLSPDKGRVSIKGLNPRKACLAGKIGYIPQNYRASLLNWRTSIDNICFPLELKGISRKNRYQKALNLIGKLGLGLTEEELGISNGKRYPYELSGGQQQKIVIARALIYNPDVLLMDEPFSALDIEGRPKMQDYILKIWKQTKITILFVSHDIEEAIYLGNRITVLKGKPVRNLKIFESTLPRPRKREMLKSNEIIELRTYIENIFLGKATC